MSAPLPSAESPSGSHGTVARWEWLLLGLIIALGAILRLYKPGLSYYNLHVERDLYRATQLLSGDDFPLLGSEMQYGGRVFGPLVYFLYAIPLAFTRSPIGVGVFIGLLNTFILFWAWAFTRRWFGPVAAIAATALYAAFPLEIVQLRYLWNPCFLPVMILGMYSMLYRYVSGGHGAFLVGVVLFFSFGFQLHFSVLMSIPVILVGMIFMRRRPTLPVLACCALLVLVLFLPMIIHELRIGRANVKDVIAAPDAVQSVAERYRLNPNAWRNLVHVVTLDWHETGSRLGFTYLYFLRDALRERLGNGFAVLSVVVVLAGAFQFVLWLAGLAGIAARLRAWWNVRRAGGADERHQARLAVLPYLLLLLWQFSPLFFLSFFNYHPMGKPGEHALIPVRYYLIAFPAQFIIAGLGTDLLARRFSSLRALLPTALAVLVTVYTVLCTLHLHLLASTGVALPYLYYRAPTLDVMLQLRDTLVEKFHVNVEDYYTRVTAQNILLVHCGEATIDYLITQDPRAWKATGLAPDTHLIIWTPLFTQPPELDPPREEERTLRLPEVDGHPRRILREEAIGDIRVLLLEGALPPDNPVFDPDLKRNFYYRQERMKYLGSERLLQ